MNTNYKVKIASAAIVCLGAMVGLSVYAAEGKKVKKKKPSAAGATTETAAPAADGATAADGAGTTPKAATEHRAPYGMAGCGLGSIVVKNHSKGPQIGAGFLNITGVQTFGISTGSSNCKLSKDDLSRVEQEVFFEVNFASLAKDTAQGQGEHIAAFAEILGCGQGESLNLFNDVSRTHYEQIFDGQDSKVVLSNFKSVIKANETLSKSCVRA